jgi:serine/threonine-protein kinase
MASPSADVEALYQTARRQHENDQDRAAIDTLTRALDRHPDYLDALELRGLLYLLDGQSAQAFADLSRALQLDPESVSAHGLRGEASRQLGMHDEAIKDFDEAIRLNPDARPSYVSRGLTYFDRGDYARATADFTIALRLKETVLVYNKRAACHYFRANYSRAIADHTAACNLEPEDDGTCNYLAWILATCPVASLRNGRRAVELAKKACERSEWKFPGYIDTLAAAYAEAGDFAQAVATMERAYNMVGDDRKEDYKSRLDLYHAGQPFHAAGAPQ